MESFCGYVRLVLRVFSPHLICFCVSCRNTAWNTVLDTFWPLVSASPVTSSPASLEASSLVEALRRSECLCRNATRISAVSWAVVGTTSRIQVQSLSKLSVFFTLSSPCGEQRANVGLNLKFNKKNEEVPGYTKRTEKEWLYSAAVEELLAEYLDR